MDFLPEHIRNKIRVDEETGCWIWTGAKYTCGYGKLRVRNHHNFRAHRYVFNLAFQVELTPDQILRHKCDNPTCVNPSHLVVGSHADNVADRVARGRSATGIKHGRAKLDPDQVMQIRQKLANGQSKASIAREHSVDRMLIFRISRNEIWKSVK